jgi:hypothetical protein
MGAQIPDTRSPGRINFVRWHQLFVGPLYETLHVTLLVPRILRCLLGFNGPFECVSYYLDLKLKKVRITAKN